MITTDTIIKDPNPLLRQKSEKIELPLSQEDQQLVDSLYEYVVNSTNPELAQKYNLQPAVGIAAPQIGVLKQACAIVIYDYDDEGEITNTTQFVLINPVILETSGEQTGQEGCLSVPGKYGIVTRPNYVKVAAYNEEMEPIEVEGTELLARALCHEIAHLEGQLYVELAEGGLKDVEPYDDEEYED